jgi:hypothetical protein
MDEDVLLLQDRRDKVIALLHPALLELILLSERGEVAVFSFRLVGEGKRREGDEEGEQLHTASV